MAEGLAQNTTENSKATDWRSRGYTVVRIVLGGLLLTAAGLKAHGLWAGTADYDGLLTTPRMQVAAIEIEVILGLWLLNGQAKRGAWIAAIGWFSVLALASLYMGLDGQADCGCLGTIAKVNPWWTFAFDLVVLGTLLWYLQRLRNLDGASLPLSPVLRVLAGAIAFVIAISGAFTVATDDPEATLARLRGESISIIPPVSDMGEGLRGESRSFIVVVRNNTSNSVRVVGGTSNCRCVTTTDLPISLGPNQSSTVEIQATFTGTPGRFFRKFILYVDDKHATVAVAGFRGRISAASN